MGNISQHGELASGLHSAAGVETGGILVLDKPAGFTSAKAAARIKKLLSQHKIGHAGTLDPFATGVLVLCLNEATRAADQITNLNKVYHSTLRFGIETDTLDWTGQVIRQSDRIFLEKDLIEVLRTFEGTCMQTVPRFSAVRVEGRRLYELSRKGIEVEQPEREICIHAITLQYFRWPEAVIEVCCSKGTYIRQLASDVGRKLGSGAHLSALRRTSVGPFTLERAIRMDEEISAASVAAGIIPLNEALSHLPAALMSEQWLLGRLRNGQLDPVWKEKQREYFCDRTDAVRIVTGTNRLAALWWPNSARSGSRCLRVFPF
jgi:tRNA pseudouridine55 synthase